MEKQITELLKLLNKGVEHLPQAASTMVHQYAMREWVMAAGFLVFAIMLTIACALVAKMAINYEPYNTYDDRAVFIGWGGIALGASASIMLVAAFIYAANAVSPIYSLVQSLR